MSKFRIINGRFSARPMFMDFDNPSVPANSGLVTDFVRLPHLRNYSKSPYRRRKRSDYEFRSYDLDDDDDIYGTPFGEDEDNGVRVIPRERATIMSTNEYDELLDFVRKRKKGDADFSDVMRLIEDKDSDVNSFLIGLRLKRAHKKSDDKKDFSRSGEDYKEMLKRKEQTRKSIKDEYHNLRKNPHFDVNGSDGSIEYLVDQTKSGDYKIAAWAKKKLAGRAIKHELNDGVYDDIVPSREEMEGN